MPSLYSEDLRLRVVNTVENGKTVKRPAKLVRSIKSV
jgi:hypothetical protein